MEKHECCIEDIEWECCPDGKPYYYVAGCGETLERNGKCNICGKTYREIYIHSCYMDDATNEEALL